MPLKAFSLTRGSPLEHFCKERQIQVAESQDQGTRPQDHRSYLESEVTWVLLRQASQELPRLDLPGWGGRHESCEEDSCCSDGG